MLRSLHELAVGLPEVIGAFLPGPDLAIERYVHSSTAYVSVTISRFCRSQMNRRHRNRNLRFLCAIQRHLDRDAQRLVILDGNGHDIWLICMWVSRMEEGKYCGDMGSWAPGLY